MSEKTLAKMAMDMFRDRLHMHLKAKLPNGCEVKLRMYQNPCNEAWSVGVALSSGDRRIGHRHWLIRLMLGSPRATVDSEVYRITDMVMSGLPPTDHDRVLEIAEKCGFPHFVKLPQLADTAVVHDVSTYEPAPVTVSIWVKRDTPWGFDYVEVQS
jgi:hypothetical protein